MVRFRARTAVAVLLPLLGACYTSVKPLVTASQAVFPFQTITFTPAGQEPSTMTHQGNVYVSTDGSGDTADMLLLPVGGPFYVMQVHVKDGSDGYLYGLLKVDLAAKTAAAYATTATPADVGPGLAACHDDHDSVCLTQLQPYIAHAMAIAGASTMPDEVYRLDFK